MWLQHLLGGCTIFKGKSLAIISIIGFTILGSQPCFADKTPVVEFTMKPNICVLSESESQCRDLLTAEWKSQNNKHYSLCLYQQTSKTPIECWENANAGKAEFTQTLSTTTVFELRDMSGQTLLVQQAFQVISAQKKFQHSRRNPWSFF